MSERHSTLKRQLRRAGNLSEDATPDLEQWKKMLDLINKAYEGIDQERYLNERSIDVSTKEMTDLYSKLKEERDKLQEMTNDLQANEKQLLHHAQQLERSNEQLERFAFIASHDLQEPLRKIELFSSLIIDDSKDKVSDESQQMMESMNGSVRRMRALVNGLLEFSRITNSGTAFTEVNLAELMESIIDDLQLRINENEAKVVVETSLPVTKGCESHLNQLFLNLISNALKFKKKDENPFVKIYHEEIREGEKIKVTIEDNGIGIEKEYISRIFKIFQRLHGKDQYEGSGIGLAVCDQIATNHGGTIDVSSKLGVGSKFIVTLQTDLNSGL